MHLFLEVWSGAWEKFVAFLGTQIVTSFAITLIALLCEALAALLTGKPILHNNWIPSLAPFVLIPGVYLLFCFCWATFEMEKRNYNHRRVTPHEDLGLKIESHRTRSVWIANQSIGEGKGLAADENAYANPESQKNLLLATVARFRPTVNRSWITAQIDYFDKDFRPALYLPSGGLLSVDHGCWIGAFNNKLLPRIGSTVELVLALQKPDGACATLEDRREDERSGDLRHKPLDTPKTARVTLRSMEGSGIQVFWYQLDTSKNGRLFSEEIAGPKLGGSGKIPPISLEIQI